MIESLVGSSALCKATSCSGVAVFLSSVSRLIACSTSIAVLLFLSGTVDSLFPFPALSILDDDDFAAAFCPTPNHCPPAMSVALGELFKELA